MADGRDGDGEGGNPKDPGHNEPEAVPGTSRDPAGARSMTESGITDPAVLAAIEANKTVIAEAQKRIAAMTGGKTSRTGTSAVSKGSATVSVSRSYHETATTKVSPTTFLDPVTGELRTVNVPAPGVYTLQPPGARARVSLLHSLPEHMRGEGGLPSDPDEILAEIEGDEGGASDPLYEPSVAGEVGATTRTGRPNTRASTAAAAAAGEKGPDPATAPDAAPTAAGKGVKEKTEKREADAGPPAPKQTGHTRLLLSDNRRNVHYELFIKGPHDYEEGDEILLRHKDGTNTPVVVVTVEENAVVGPNGQVGAVGPTATDEEMKAAKEGKTETEHVAPTAKKSTTPPATSGKKKPPKQTHPAGELPGHGSVELDPYDEADDAALQRGIDKDKVMEKEPPSLCQIWEWTDEKVARARKLAEDVANMGDSDKVTTRAQMKIRELEAYLHSKAGSKPKELPGMSETEVAIESEEVTGKETTKELLTRSAGYSRVAAKTALANQRGITILMGKVDLHTRVNVMMFEILNDLRRVMTKYDRPVNRDELMANPDLNPYLSGYIPFNNQHAVKEFVAQPDRTYALQRWILSKLTWDVNSFVSRMCDLVCTPEYRIKYSFPGKQTLAQLIYIPEKFATFLYGVAEQAAQDSGYFNPDKIHDQLRVAFQASSVKKRNRPESDPAKRGKKKRRKYGEVFTSTEDEEDEDEDNNQDKSELRLHEDFDNTLVDYTSYLELAKAEDGSSCSHEKEDH